MDYSLSTFDAPDGTRLDQYEGELNAEWNRVFTVSYPNLNRITNGKVHRTAENPEVGTPNFNGSEHFLSSYTIPSASYVVEAEFWNKGVFSEWTDGGPAPFEPPDDIVHPNGTVTNASEGYERSNSLAMIGGRTTTGSFNGYRIKYDQLNALWSLQKFVSGSATIDRTYFDIIPVNGYRLAQLVLRGYWVEMWIDGVCRQVFRDEGAGSFGGPGYAMLRLDSGPDNYSNNQFSSKGIHLDNFRVHDEFPYLPIPVELSLYGEGDSSGEVSLAWTE